MAEKAILMIRTHSSGCLPRVHRPSRCPRARVKGANDSLIQAWWLGFELTVFKWKVVWLFQVQTGLCDGVYLCRVLSWNLAIKYMVEIFISSFRCVTNFFLSAPYWSLNWCCPMNSNSVVKLWIGWSGYTTGRFYNYFYIVIRNVWVGWGIIIIDK